MKKISIIHIGYVMCGLAAPLAQASTVSYNDSQVLPNSTNTTVNLSKFDTTLGTLTGVYVEVGINLTGAQVELYNDDTSAQVGTGRVLSSASSLTSDVSLLKSDFTTISSGDLGINAHQDFSLTATVAGPAGHFVATGLSDYAIWTPGTLNANGQGNISNLVWSQYEGTGTFGITTNATYLTSATFAGSNGYFQGNTPSGQLYANVTYTYTPVPEPSSSALLGLGVIGLVGMRRRRK